MGHPFVPNFPELPYAEKEAEMLSRFLHLRGLSSTALIKEEATPTKFLSQLSNARVVHIACHANSNKRDNEIIPGSLLLSSDESSGTKGIVSASVIQSLNLEHLELAFLNCCETGGGELYREGLIGLGRAFLFAGTKAVILSHWNVADAEATCLLVERFYESYVTGNSAEAALRHAQLCMSEMGYEEKFWAPYFVLKTTF